MIRKTLTLAGFVLAVASPALAQTDVVDSDGDGTYSMAELQAAYPEMTAEDFGRADVDQSGDVSPDELTIAIETGLLTE
ncbi:EF-hand domain-containing protein [Marinovum sp.]|uniref:EF-hand domain-containing protein n=1 Tax=Marinovum sp. TaxID=2024839 RepID=UPI002B279065|nr:EF-hand domain-containing protein [Marinovum sp.]